MADPRDMIYTNCWITPLKSGGAVSPANFDCNKPGCTLVVYPKYWPKANEANDYYARGKKIFNHIRPKGETQ